MSENTRTSGCWNELETEAPEKRRERKWAAVRNVMDTAAERSGEFRARMAGAGLNPADIRSFDDFVSIPPVRKKEIIALQAENGLEWMLDRGIGTLRRIYQSPGPIFDPEGNGPDYWGWAEGFYAAGFRPEDVVQVTFGYHLTPAGLMMEEPLREIGCAVIPAGPGNTGAQIELMTRLPVTGFVGMAGYLKVIGQKARRAGFDPARDIGLKAAFVAAERLTESLRSEVEGMFGMMVRQGYGTADAGCIGYECPRLGGMHVSSRCWVEICDPETGRPLPDGQTGEVVVTPFTDVYPLVRLATGDLSALIPDACGCGRTSPRLAGILGRVDDTAKVKGQFIYPSQAAPVMEMFPQIRSWRIVVTNPGGRDILGVVLQTDADIPMDRFVVEFQNTLKLRPAVTILPAGEVLEDGPLLVDERTFD